MGRDCCGSQTPAPKPIAAPAAVSTEEEMTKCQGSCCGGDVEPVSTKDKGQGQSSSKTSDDDCYSSKCMDGIPDSDTDAPDCCRGRTSPCCDTSCLDRLAVRECEMSATGAPEPNGQANTCNKGADGKACSQHSLSAFDRYGATLQALRCICRDLIALGQETCCKVRDRPLVDGQQCLEESSDRSLLRSSLESCCSGGPSTKTQSAYTRLRSQKDFNEGAKSVGKSCTDVCAEPCSPDNKSAEEPPITAERSKLSWPEDGSIPEPFSKTTCAGGCCSQAPMMDVRPQTDRTASCCTDSKTIKEASTKNKCSDSCCSDNKPTAQAGRLDPSCSATSPVEEYPFKAACTLVKPVTNNDTKGLKGISGDGCCSKPKPNIEPVTTKCAGSCCGTTTQKPLAKDSSDIAVSESCNKPLNQDIAKTSVTTCVDSCCLETRPVSSQGSCADACCTSTAPSRGIEKEKGSIGIVIDDIEKQGTGKEHVVLSISGMTCTGCETKLNRTLATMSAVKELKTSLVLSRAEFNIDLRLGSVEEVIKHLERTTEFKCERVQNQGSSLDLIVPHEPSKFIDQTWPDGVIDMILVNEHTVRVAFDPKIVGARDLAEKTWDPPIELAPPRGDISLEAGNKHVRHVGYMTLLSAVLTIPVLVMAWAPLPENEIAYSSASLGLATIVQVVIAGPFYPKALKALIFSRVIEMDLLIVLSTSAAYIFSVVSFGYLIAQNPLSTDQFFETSTLLVTLIMVGRWVAALARQRAVESISIRSLQASTAILVDKESGTEREIDARILQYGDTFKVLPDSRIPTDGTVVTGSSEVDESMLTGETRPVDKYPKSVVIAGSINGSGVLTVRLNRLPSDNTITAIAAMVDEAKLSKPKLQDLADRVASYFVPVVVALTIVTFVIWVAVGMTVRGYNGSEATTQAITYAITVLIVSCPCAIGLAVPMVIVIASGVAAEKGVIFKSADAIEVAHKTSHVVFDKTGTLTRGKLSVAAQNCIDEDKLPLLLGLVENSRHPVSVAVATHLRDAGIIASPVPEPKSLTGKGVETTLGGQKLQAGNSRWLNLSQHGLVLPMLAEGYTVFCFVVDDTCQAIYGLQDDLRADAAATVETLQKRGVSVHVVSGDDDGAVQTLASKLSIPHHNVRSRSSPADKKDYIQTLLGTGADGKKPVVVFCGDGTNDAVALAQATIGVHMNEGTDIAQSAADVVLMRPALGGILTMINASRKSVNRIKFNFAWSFLYNTFAVLLAAGAFVNARIPPEFAGLGELVSVLPVIAAAVLLRWSTI